MASSKRRKQISVTRAKFTKGKVGGDKMNETRDLNVRPETIKLLEENIGKTLSDINNSRILYDPHPRILETKAKINKWDLMKLKSFCTAM